MSNYNTTLPIPEGPVLEIDLLDEDGRNYVSWASQCRILLITKSVQYTISDDFKIPTPPAEPTLTQPATEEQITRYNRQLTEYQRKLEEIEIMERDQAVAYLAIIRHLPPVLKHLLRYENQPKNIWKALQQNSHGLFNDVSHGY